MVANYVVSQRDLGILLHPRNDTLQKHSQACTAGGAGRQERTVLPGAQGPRAGDFARTFNLPPRRVP